MHLFVCLALDLYLAFIIVVLLYDYCSCFAVLWVLSGYLCLLCV